MHAFYIAFVNLDFDLCRIAAIHYVALSRALVDRFGCDFSRN